MSNSLHMTSTIKKPKATLQSLLATSQVLTGTQVIEKQKAQQLLAEEFARAAEFESRNGKGRG